MAGSQSHRGGDAQTPASGTRNRGFVSSDPERQSEQVSDRAARPPVQPAQSFRFGLRRPPGAVRSVRKPGAPAPDAQTAHEAPQGKGSKRRAR